MQKVAPESKTGTTAKKLYVAGKFNAMSSEQSQTVLQENTTEPGESNTIILMFAFQWSFSQN